MFSAFLSAGAVSPVTGTLPFNPTPPYLPFGFGKPWEIFRQRWYMLADRLDHRIAKPGSLLDGKIRTYGSEWESSDGFLDALAYSFIGKVSEVAATVALRKLHPVEAAKLRPLSSLLTIGAQFAAKTSAKRAVDAADTIVKDVTELLLLSDPAESAAKQKIHLIGHSRGAAVNAHVAQELDNKGYKIDQYTALDGFSTDWPDGAGLIGDISIVGELASVSGRKVNYQVQEDIANFVVDIRASAFATGVGFPVR